MMRQKRSRELLYAGVDVGTTKVATIVARVGPTGMEVVALGRAPSEGMRKGLVVDAEALTASVRSSGAEAASVLGTRLPPAYVSVTGAHLACVNAAGTISRTHEGSRPRAFTPADVHELLASSVPQVDGSRVLLHAVPRRFEIDGQSPVRDPVGACGETLATETHVVSGDAAAVADLARAVRHAGVKVRGMVLQHLASASAVLSAEEMGHGVVLLDVGGGTTDVAVFLDRAVWHTSSIPVAGHHFTSDLAFGLGIPPAAAERLKLQYGPSDPDEHRGEVVELEGGLEGGPQVVSRRRLHQLLRDRAVELVQLVLHQLREAGLTRIPAGGIVLTGGSAKLSALAAAAAEYGRCPVRLAAPSSALGLPEELDDASFATAVGLLLWAVEHQRASVVPKTVTPPREWTRKLPSGLSLRRPQGVPA